MDFRKLSFFEAVCRLHSFTKAAEELHVTQPSITVAIQNLEEELEILLLNRYRGGFSLTPEGELLFCKAKLVLKELDDITLELRAAASDRIRRLRVGYGIQMRETLSGLIESFQKSHVNVEIIENESSTPSILRQLEEGMLDLGIVVSTKNMNKTMELYPLFQGEIKICACSKNPLCSFPSVSLDLFEQQPLISLSLNEPKNSFIFGVLEDAYPYRRISFKPLYSSLLLDSYFQRILNNDGIGLTYHDKWFSAAQYNPVPENGNYRELSFDPPCFYSVSIIHSKAKEPTEVQQAFIQYVKNSL